MGPEDAPTTAGPELPVRDDTSLQAWGRSLKNVEPAYGELRGMHREPVEADRRLATSLTRMAQLSEHDLPVDKPLASEMGDLAATARRIADASEALQADRQALAGRASGLPRMYDYHHGNDEDRLTEPRNGPQAEKRADVTHASQDT